MSDPILRTKALTKRFGGLVAVSDVSLDLHVGEVHVVIGPNGAGKSTLTNLLSGDLPPNSGEVVFEGRDIAGCSSAHISRQALGNRVRRTHCAFFIVPKAIPRSIGGRKKPWMPRDSSIAPNVSPPHSRTANSANWKSPCAWRRSRASCCSMSHWPAWGRTSRSAWSS